MKELFKDDDLAYDVWASKYRFEDENKEDFFLRLIKPFLRTFSYHKELSDYGKSRLNDNYEAVLDDLLYDFKHIIFGGSGLSGIGTGRPVSISNCYVLKTGDSVSEIFDTSKNMANIYKRRGGVGTDLSSLRPRGAHVNNAAKTTSGVVPFMELYSQTTNTIGQDGRRGALMISLDVRHPDSPEFAVAKRDLTKITGANVSLKVEADFIKAVENDEDYILRWPLNLIMPELDKDLEYNKLYPLASYGFTIGYVKKIRAKELWDTIIESNWMSAEPGILFWDNIINNDPASVYEEFRAISTNPCGEIPLSDKDACRLLATNVYSLVSDPFTKNACIDETLAYKVFYEALIMNDTIVDIELEHIKRIIAVDDDPDFWQEIYNVGQNGRRTGAGLTGLGDMYAALGVPYGHPETTEKLMKIKVKAELEASIDLAINDGPFPAYNRDLEFSSNLVGKLNGKNDFFNMILEEFPEQVRKMWKYGRRNISWSTVAPTGSISLLTQTTSGCEPLFSPYYMRRKKVNASDENQRVDFVDDVGEKWQEYPVLHPKFKLWIEMNLEDPENGYDDYTWDSRALDEAFSNSPWFGNTANDLTPEQRIECQSILQRYTTHSISSTVNLPNEVTQETINELYVLASKMGLKGLTTYRDGSRQGVLVSGKVDPVKVTERPEQIDCKVIRFKNEKKNWVAFVGLVNNKPYEIFTGINELDAFPIPTYVEEGSIIKVSTPEGSRYDFRYKDSYGYVNTLGGLNRIFSKEYWNYARLTSAILRENVEIVNVIKILSKLEFSNKSMNTWQAGVIRALSPFVADGVDSKEMCPECEQDSLVYQEGCLTCHNCGFSKCG